MKKNHLNKISQLLEKELNKGTFPGAVISIVNENEIFYLKAYGYAQLYPIKREMSLQTIFDMASLTKVIATTTSIMQLIERGEINLWDYLKEYFPEIPQEKEDMTIFHLLTHTSGYQAIVRLWDKSLNYEEKIKYILDLPLEEKISTKVIYSDLNFILLGELIRRVTGIRLDKYARENIFKPLNMDHTDFNPLNNLKDIDKNNFAATEWCDFRECYMLGEVHDENAFSFSGVSGHAGLFSTVEDLSIFVKMLLNKGIFKETKILSPRSIEIMTRDWTPNKADHRGLGWDLINNFRSSGGVLFSPSAFGHTGFTGTSIWIDPKVKIGVVLLTNRVHPTRDNVKLISLRPRLHNLIAATLFSER